MAKTPKRPRDMMQLAKFVGEIATQERDKEEPSPTPRQARAAKGGKARAAKLTRKKRVAIAREAGKASASARKRSS